MSNQKCIWGPSIVSLLAFLLSGKTKAVLIITKQLMTPLRFHLLTNLAVSLSHLPAG